jgi:hypothetical protein
MNQGNGILQRLTQFIRAVFKTTVEVFLEALKLSPNAQGYIAGSITELLLKRKLEGEYSCEVKRIREKWEGKKHPNHHGDFYFKMKNASEWYVIESKGVKSNSEKWHKLYNYEGLKRFLIIHSEKIPWVDTKGNVEQQIEKWIADNLPEFLQDYANNLYDFEEVQRYLKNLPGRETKKCREIKELESLNRDDIANMIDERLAYLMSKVKVLETHFVSGTSGSSGRTQATPRFDEFNLVAVDIFLRYSEHKFLFANPKLLDPSGSDSNHLQQNYIMGFVFFDTSGNESLHTTEDWYEEFYDAYDTLNSEDKVEEDDMQVDLRQLISYTDLDQKNTGI